MSLNRPPILQDQMYQEAQETHTMTHKSIVLNLIESERLSYSAFHVDYERAGQFDEKQYARLLIAAKEGASLQELRKALGVTDKNDHPLITKLVEDIANEAHIHPDSKNKLCQVKQAYFLEKMHTPGASLFNYYRDFKTYVLPEMRKKSAVNLSPDEENLMNLLKKFYRAGGQLLDMIHTEASEKIDIHMENLTRPIDDEDQPPKKVEATTRIAHIMPFWTAYKLVDMLDKPSQPAASTENNPKKPVL